MSGTRAVAGIGRASVIHHTPISTATAPVSRAESGIWEAGSRNHTSTANTSPPIRPSRRLVRSPRSTAGLRWPRESCTWPMAWVGFGS